MAMNSLKVNSLLSWQEDDQQRVRRLMEALDSEMTMWTLTDVAVAVVVAVVVETLPFDQQWMR